MPDLRIPRRFNGPRSSGNGGWSAGALAATLPDAGMGRSVTVTLRMPPPLDVPLPLTVTEDGMLASYQGRTVAQASYADRVPEPVPPVPVREAALAEARYKGHKHHPFPTCFACGTHRRPGDGLRIFPGPVGFATSSTTGADVAATWTPFESSVPITWAALDCPGGWASDLEERPVVLGTITVRIERLPTTAERYVVVGAQRRVEGRKTYTAATLYDPVGEVVATAEHIWIAIDPEEFA
jgi:hypothetical protein